LRGDLALSLFFEWRILCLFSVSDMASLLSF
jgi:hypothetical protein